MEKSTKMKSNWNRRTRTMVHFRVTYFYVTYFKYFSVTFLMFFLILGTESKTTKDLLSPVTMTISMNRYFHSKEDAMFDKCMDLFYVDEVRYMRCNVCIEFPEIVRQHCMLKFPSIAMQTGTKYRSDVYRDHISKSFHVECPRARNLKFLNKSALTVALMDVAVRRANSERADYLGNLLINVFTDAKKLTVSGWNWPARYMTSEAGIAFRSNETQPTIPPNINLSYINPPKHLEHLDCIVLSDYENMKKKMRDALAISLRVDGSVDFTQIDKIYVLCKIINPNGLLELIFVGIGEQIKPGAEGLLKAVTAAIHNLCGDVN